MAKSLLDENVLPRPLTPYATGDAAADAAIAKLQTWELSAYSPQERPGGYAYDAAVAAASAVGAARLLPLLDDAACATGQRKWSDERVDKMKLGEKRAFKQHHETVVHAIKARSGYLRWLVAAVLPQGFECVLAIACGKGTAVARCAAAEALAALTDQAKLRAFGEAVDPHAWDGKDPELARVYRAAVAARNATDPAWAYDSLVALIAPAAVTQPGGEARAEAVLLGLRASTPDPRWIAAALPLLATPVDTVATLFLESQHAAPAPAPVAPPATPARTRPTLVYKKTKAFKRPKLESLAAQQKALDKLFAAADLGKVQPRVVQRAACFVPARVDEKTLALGATKLGGHPDLPAKTAWPRAEGEPLTFVAQLRLADVAPLPPLPATGLLSFFVANDPLSEKVEYLKVAKVLFTPATAKLVRREVPDDFVDRIFFACKVEVVPRLSLPSPSNAHLTTALTPDQVARYEADVFDAGAALPQVLGYRDHGYDAEEPATAQMLLQLTGDDQSGMEFGDCEYLAFFIDAKRLARHDFGKVWPHVGD